jgi:hypothetical protein
MAYDPTEPSTNLNCPLDPPWPYETELTVDSGPSGVVRIGVSE